MDKEINSCITFVEFIAINKKYSLFDSMGILILSKALNDHK